MDPVRIGLIGAGWVAERHLEAIARIEGVEAAGVCARTRERSVPLAAKHGVAIVADSVGELVEKAQPDALMVLVSEEAVHDVALEAMRFGLPLFVEKPAGLTPEENHDLACRAEEACLLSMVGFNRRFYSVFRKGLDIVRVHGRLLGVTVEGHERMWRIREGGKFSDRVLDEWIYANSVHTIDLMRFFGGEVLSVHSLARRAYGEAHGDQFAALMELDGGAIGTYQANWYSPGGWRAVLYGDGVTVEFRPLEEGRWTGKSFETHVIEPDPEDVGVKVGYVRQMEAFARLVREGVLEPPALDLRGSYETMALAQRMCAEVEDVAR
ncbi:MAG: Gfo/Idh/MocA family oxidoreductase [Coriobacteriia bacterium]